ncbi:hypothetical protein [Proteus hauseri]|uniref:hypothetical protein n=1 Tax=Proteus hauseri TaxID=183417 RepID=UPI00100969B9|nr:hypothetical protein [Proteus hauseri]QAV22325.1 hypothetical protein PH4a_02770 [Proteus hauseri]
MATVVESLIVSLKLDNTEFGRAVKQAIEDNEQLSDAVNGVGDASKDAGININIYTQQTKKSNDETDKAKKKNKDLEKTINGVVKALSGLFTTIFVSTGLQKLIDETSKTNEQLYFLSKNLGMNATDIKRWQNMAEMTGGSADGMAASLSGLSQSLWNLVTTGDASILPWFNALNVDVVNSGGQIRDLNDILLDVSDSLSKMSRPQAYNIAKNMGFDDGTINLLLEGRQAMQQMLETQKHIVISSEEELKLSRQLNQQNALVSKQWEGLKTLIANYLMPYFLRFSEKVSGWLDYLNKNRDVAKDLFKGMAVVLTLFLIPALIKGAVAMAAMFAPLLTGTGLVLALAAALVLLYRDYQGWKQGKDSVFDWTEWSETIEMVLGWLDGLSEWFKNTSIGKWFTDQDGKVDGWKLALGGLLAFFTGKFAAGFGKTILSIGSAFAGLLGWPGVIIAAVAGSLLWFKDFVDNLDLGSLAPEMANVTMTGVKTADALSHVSKDKSNAENANVILSSLDWLIPGGKAIGHATEEIDKKGIRGATESFVNDAGGFLKRVISANKPDKDQSETTPKLGNTRGERNNNPLNMNFVGQKGATLEEGKNARFAKFETPYEGLERTVKQLMLYFDGKSRAVGNRKLQTVQDIVKAWAPSADNNDTKGYVKRVSEKLSVSPTEIINLNDPEVMYALMNAMSKEEIGKQLPYDKSLVMAAIKGQGDPSANLVNNLNSFNKAISKPIVSNTGLEAQNFLSQTQKLNSQPKTVNNKTEVTVNGGINVTSTADTIKGTVEDGRVAARESLSQIMPTMI